MITSFVDVVCQVLDRQFDLVCMLFLDFFGDNSIFVVVEVCFDLQCQTSEFVSNRLKVSKESRRLSRGTCKGSLENKTSFSASVLS